MDPYAVMVVEAAKVPNVDRRDGNPKGAPKSYTQNEMDLYLPIYNPAICFSLCPLPCTNLAGGYIRTEKEKKKTLTI